MTKQWEFIIKTARDCHTKQSWEEFFSSNREKIESAGDSKIILELFKLLKADSQSLQYAPSIWGILIKGASSSWNFELGQEIATFALKVSSPSIAIPATQVFLESNNPVQAREIATRALRFAGLQPKEKVQFEILICSSYAEEGKRSKASRLLEEVSAEVRRIELDARDRADFFLRMGRMQFFIGQYQKAAALFQEAYQLYLSLSEWGQAAITIFNAAACFSNADTKLHSQAFSLVEECRKLSEIHNLPVTLAHCNTFYGIDAFQHGDFAGATEHFQRALKDLPPSDKSFRRLNILSFQSLTYSAAGKHHLAKRFAEQTLTLADQDQSERYKSRYNTLKAYLFWEDGHVDESLEILAESVKQMKTHGLHNLESLSTLSRYYLQSALVGNTQLPIKLIIDENLKNHVHTWNEYLFSCGQIYLNADDFDNCEKIFEKCLTKARTFSDKHYESLALLGLIQTSLKAGRPIEEVKENIKTLEIVAAKLGDSPIKPQIQFIHAAKAYREGNFAECQRFLKLAAKNTRAGFAERSVVEWWIDTFEGRACRLTEPWQISMLSRFTKLYFAPSISMEKKGIFRVSNHYEVNLENHPALADLLVYLFMKSSFSATAAEIQTQVWKQSLKSEGWEQKIRNTIMRIRDFFPCTMAPLIIHCDTIRLFSEAILVNPLRADEADSENEIRRLLKDSPMSSMQISGRLRISAATAKRILKRLSDDEKIISIRQGRNIFYKAVDQQPNAPTVH